MADYKTLFVVFCFFIVLVKLTLISVGFNNFPGRAPALYETLYISINFHVLRATILVKLTNPSLL